MKVVIVGGVAVGASAAARIRRLDEYNFAGGFRFYDVVTNDRTLTCRVTACGMDK